jgi:sulfite reductase alpha subunit-like flavoprotein
MSETQSGQRHDRSALILYGSETGNAQDAAEQLGRHAERLRFSTRVAAMDSVGLVR